MPSSTEPTPRPWYVEDPIPGRPDDEDVEITAVGDPHDIGVAMMVGGYNNRVTAELIVEAVNNYDRLRAVVQQALDAHDDEERGFSSSCWCYEARKLLEEN